MFSRLDKILATKFPKYSRSYIQSLISKKLVHVNQKVAKKNKLCRPEEQISVLFPKEDPNTLKPESMDISILYEDQDMIAVDKPKGLVVHPGANISKGTLANWLVQKLGCTNSCGHPQRPFIVHRIDKNTTGVLIAAKNKKSLEALQDSFRNREVVKEYITICDGSMVNTTVNLPIGRDTKIKTKMSITSLGKEAITRFEVIANNKDKSLIKAFPKTGRTHQIRIHLKSLGHSIQGDPLYGKENGPFCLHSKSIEIAHPTTKKTIKISAPIPMILKKETTLFLKEIEYYFTNNVD